jgi:5-methylcytosine-specific restriction endonuclease McrA
VEVCADGAGRLTANRLVDLTPFLSSAPTVEDCWRGVVLYGRNTASYKFALASALLEMRPMAGQLVKLEELAPAFALNVARHLAEAPKQITTSNGKFIEACLTYNQDQNLNNLVDSAVSQGFVNVIDAFHVVASTPVAQRFFLDERRENKGIRITDEFSLLINGTQSGNLSQEVDSRWRLVETAWNLGISANLLCVHHDDVAGEMFTFDKANRRKSVTSSRGALNGYQKGRCFYCFTDLSLQGDTMNTDVDHFFPHKLKQLGLGVNLDGVWNLVLSCPTCNRGAKGKFDRIPSERLLRRLHNRNEYFIGSHHPLRETLMQQTGANVSDRVAYLSGVYQKVQLNPSLAWDTQQVTANYF